MYPQIQGYQNQYQPNSMYGNPNFDRKYEGQRESLDRASNDRSSADRDSYKNYQSRNMKPPR